MKIVIIACLVFGGCVTAQKCKQSCQTRQITALDYANYRLCVDSALNRDSNGQPRLHGPLGVLGALAQQSLCNRHINPKTCYCK